MNTVNKPSKPTAKMAQVVVKAPAKTAKPASVKKTPPSSPPKVNLPDELAGKTLVPETPEQKKNSGAKRKRLSKAFLRPLDKKLKRGILVRDSFNFPEAEYAHLVELKQRLVAAGVDVKKSELLRAGLVLLAALDEETLKEFLAKVPGLVDAALIKLIPLMVRSFDRLTTQHQRNQQITVRPEPVEGLDQRLLNAVTGIGK